MIILHRRTLITGTYPSLIYTFTLSVISIIFIGLNATKGPQGAYSVPDASGLKYVNSPIYLVIILLILIYSTGWDFLH